MLQRYSQGLTNLGIEANGQHNSKSSHSSEEKEGKLEGSSRESHSPCSGSGESGSSSRWLKCVSIRRLSSSDSGPRSPRGRTETSTMALCLPLSIPLTNARLQLPHSIKVPPTPPLSSSQTGTMIHDMPECLLSDPRTEQLVSGSIHDHQTCKLPTHVPPYLSSFEKEGLVTLIQQMRKEHLFDPTACTSQTSASQLLNQLESQLNNPLLKTVCSREPNGVCLLTPPLSTLKLPRKRMRPRGGERQLQKRSKPSCAVQLSGSSGSGGDSCSSPDPIVLDPTPASPMLPPIGKKGLVKESGLELPKSRDPRCSVTHVTAHES